MDFAIAIKVPRVCNEFNRCKFGPIMQKTSNWNAQIYAFQKEKNGNKKTDLLDEKKPKTEESEMELGEKKVEMEEKHTEPIITSETKEKDILTEKKNEEVINLIGKNLDEMGPRFPDMSQPYHLEMNRKFHQIADINQIELFEGVYVAVPGPNLETRAEYRFLRGIGADVVGMSTVPEVIVANQIGLPCAAISVVTDECDPDYLEVANIKDILANAAKAEIKLNQLFEGFIREYEI